MGDTWFWLVVGAVGIFMGGVLFLRFRSINRRRQAFQSFALRAGFSQLKRFPAIESYRRIFPLLRRGSFRRFRHVYARNEPGLRIIVCDYEYSFSLPAFSRAVCSQTIIVFDCDQLDLPSFTLAPVSGLERYIPLFKGKTISVLFSEEFSRDYVLKGDDVAHVKAVFTPTCVEFFTRRDSRPRFTINASGQHILFAQHGRSLDPGILESSIRDASKAIAHLRGVPVFLSEH